jgi:hypothetical protein
VKSAKCFLGQNPWFVVCSVYRLQSRLGIRYSLKIKLVHAPCQDETDIVYLWGSIEKTYDDQLQLSWRGYRKVTKKVRKRINRYVEELECRAIEMKAFG